MVVHIWENTENHWVAHFKGVNRIMHRLQLNKSSWRRRSREHPQVSGHIANIRDPTAAVPGACTQVSWGSPATTCHDTSCPPRDLTGELLSMWLGQPVQYPLNLVILITAVTSKASGFLKLPPCPFPPQRPSPHRSESRSTVLSLARSIHPDYRIRNDPGSCIITGVCTT